MILDRRHGAPPECSARTSLVSVAFAILAACLQGTSLASPAVGPKPAAVRPVRVLRVGPGEKLSSPSQAAAEARDGDTIEIRAGSYEGDAAVWTKDHLTIRGVGGRPHLKAGGAAAEGKAIWVIRGKDTTVENVEFSGATVSDGNGAGIRGEAEGLIVRQCFFHDNQTGILVGTNDGDLLIESSEFANNGTGDGQTHNIYIGGVRSFTLRDSYSHHTRTGHNLKSRARENFVLYNRLMDETTGSASFEAEFPDGGVVYLIGNVIQKGPEAQNAILFSYAAESMAYPVNEVYVVNNTFVNERPNGGVFVLLRNAPTVAKVVNNIFAGRGEPTRGAAVESHNLTSSRPRFVDPKGFDYRLKSGSPAIDAGEDPGSVHGFRLVPALQPVSKTGATRRPAVGAIDLGAIEFERSR